MKSSLKKPKRIRRQTKISALKKSSIIQKRGSKNLKKAVHTRQGSLPEMKKDEIQQRMAQLASFPEFNPSPIVEIDLMGQVQYLNPSAENLLPDLRSKGPDHPWIADFEELTHLVQQVSEKSYLREKRLGDSWYQQVIYYTPEWKRIRIYGYDITRQKRVEDLVHQGEERYRKLFEDDLTGDFLATPDGTILDCNPSFIKIFGFASKEEGLNTNFLDLCPNHEEKEVFMNRLREKGKLEFYESVLLKRDGTFMNVVENIVGHFDEQGNLEQFKGYLFNNTEHKRAEEKLKESERKYRELYEGSQDGFVVVDMDGNIKESNSAYRQMIGYSEAELMGVPYFVLTPEKWHSMEAKIVKEQVLVKGYSDVYEKEYRKKNGTIFPISLRTYLIRDADGKPQGMWAFVRDITKRKEMEENLRRTRDELEMRVQERTAELRKAYQELEEQSKILESFFRYNITPFVVLDKNFNFMRVNEAYAKACQRDVSDFPGHNHFEFYPNEENEAIFRRVVETKAPFQTFAKPFTFPDHPELGTTYWDWTLTPLLDKMGEVEYLVFSLRDVTQRTKAEEAVKIEQQRFNDVLEILPAYLVLLTPDYHVSFANRFFRERFGESHGRRCFEYLFGRSEPCEICDTYKVLKTMVPHEWEWTGPDGRNYHVFDFPFIDTDGSTLILEMGIDITERKKAENGLRQNEELLRNVLELLPVGVWITDRNGVIIQGNPAGHQIWAGSRYVGIEQYGEYKGWWLDTGKRIDPEEWAAARAIMRGETSLNEEIEIECFDGTHKVILNSAIPLRNEKNEIIGSIIINDDVTERKRTEKALRQMQKMEALGTLAGGIAHDFNNILMPIVINTELALLDTPEGSSMANYLKLVQEAANRGKDLIKQIITFSRQKEQVKMPVEISPIIKEALKLLKSSIPRSIEIRENIEGIPHWVLADPTQIHQVLMNLCSNAAYAMREKGGVLDVSLVPVEVDTEMVNRHLDLKPGPYLRLTVADTGQGMNKEVMERAFDPFFTTKKSGEGIGMGLAVVHGIIKNHRGAITVYSEIGKGSTFNIFLPEIKEVLNTETAPLETITTGNERILLIDDEEIQIRSIQPMLERLGYRVTAKTEAIEALDIFRLRPHGFDLVITDQTMPHMTGQELAEELLRIRPDIPIILCTGFSEVIHEEEAKARGIRKFIMKPFSLSEMAGIIRKSLERNG